MNICSSSNPSHNEPEAEDNNIPLIEVPSGMSVEAYLASKGLDTPKKIDAPVYQNGKVVQVDWKEVKKLSETDLEGLAMHSK